jgi:hypothetical protein
MYSPKIFLKLHRIIMQGCILGCSDFENNFGKMLYVIHFGLEKEFKEYLLQTSFFLYCILSLLCENQIWVDHLKWPG